MNKKKELDKLFNFHLCHKSSEVLMIDRKMFEILNFFNIINHNSKN